MQWPGTTVVSVRSLKGAMHGPNYLPGQPQPLSLELLDLPKSGPQRKLTSLTTDDRGGFDFGVATPGLYVINLHPSGLQAGGSEIAGSIVVDVGPSAPSEHLELELSWSSCGLGYSDQSKCPRPENHIEWFSGTVRFPNGTPTFRGGVASPGGAPMRGAHLSLIDQAGAVAEQLVSDQDGNFNSSRILTGHL